jgi:hypothetical protein
MNSKISLRIAAFLMLFHTVGHTIGALSWKDAPNPAVAAVIRGMQSNHFNFMGRSSTIASFYEGYGMIMIFVLLLVSVTLWLLSGEIGNALTARLLIPLTVFLFLLAVAEFIYFFPFAAAISLLACIAVLMARVSVRKVLT